MKLAMGQTGNDATAFRVANIDRAETQVASQARQPWAEGCNPFGIGVFMDQFLGRVAWSWSQATSMLLGEE